MTQNSLGALTTAASSAASSLLTQERMQTLQNIRSQGFANLRPWSSMLQGLKLPENSSVAFSRLNKNLVWFQSNYFAVVFVLLIYVLISNLWLTFSIFFIMGSLAFISKMPTDRPSNFLFMKDITPMQARTAVAVISIPLLWISAAGSAVFWIVGAASVLVGGHAACLEPPVEQAFEEPV